MASTPVLDTPAATKPQLRVVIAAPRGFCAGVDRAIRIVELAIERYGAPVYVRHEIVHNKFVVDSLRAKGAVFVEELHEVPDGVPVIFSAHGVPKVVPAKAEARGLDYIDATCPLVSKVHRQAERFVDQGRHILFIGHARHPEVIGTFGQVDDGAMTLVETVEEAQTVQPPEGPLGLLTQTTLSVDDTRDILTTLQSRFPDLVGPKGEDICYATSNRQEAVKELAAKTQVVLVLGSPKSSNSLRLVEVAERGGSHGQLIQRAADVDWRWLRGVTSLGITAGASAPETLVQELIDALHERFELTIEEVRTASEDIVFKLPRALA
ncbi:4-hydroxy-3-methylbut-2-enyl diphosphate reductase [Sphingoaurantiacus capsulatus]|uniref:4-hydroxy-3-methylbut-2-enyl diphosphate reductase n=1 Tax=Sphingoaurantiacus capsulatus TaxID=1771310 RepID=A0ABV7XBA7_9SPHN